ncbi:Por secretion system C-terminal sorting domain-containing protein [Dyadobacter soli]|uniref:Por secretion system C-terminal sorting domain-containing protein n=1 Tax=Dyadobacter soli TaxID=659014 RepID=A0A1G7U4R1_9BACT|nr:T9SS type A sorting domain-containing protein [Dyadobacter soli]SDG42622.1 Por secretion system C-terminal sorting domain-containing protein [Dyadobacter soli]
MINAIQTTIKNQISARGPQYFFLFNLLLLLVLRSVEISAQQKVFGNVFIPAGGEVTVFGAQDLGSGKITTARGIAHGTLNTTASAQFTNINGTHFVDGAVKKLNAGLSFFPVGDGTFYGPFTASSAGTTGMYFHSDPAGASFPVTARQATLSFVNNSEYWLIEGANTTPVTLTWNKASALADHLSKLDNIRIVGWKNGIWTEIPSRLDANSILGGPSSPQSGSITSSEAIKPDDFKAFAIGTKSETLPVTLVEFNVKKESSTAILSWTTTSETNSHHFAIERSGNSKTWQNIGIVKSLRESSARHEYHFVDSAPIHGINYYRLKMVDADETFAYSSVRSLDFDFASEGITTYPNPAFNVLKIQPRITDGNRRSQVTITDLNGRRYGTSTQWTGDDLNIEKLPSGIYILSVPTQSGEMVQTKFIVQK